MPYLNEIKMPYSDNYFIELIQKFLDNITLPIFSILAAMGGGIIATRFHEPKTRIEAIAIMFGGFCVAVFLGSMFTEWVGVTGRSEAGIHFVIALVGMYIVEGLINIGKSFANNPLDTVKNIKELKDPRKKRN